MRRCWRRVLKLEVELVGVADDAFASLDPGDEIIVYRSNPACRASAFAYKELRKRGYENVRRFEGGLMAWEDAGYPLVGEWVT